MALRHMIANVLPVNVKLLSEPLKICHKQLSCLRGLVSCVHDAQREHLLHPLTSASQGCSHRSLHTSPLSLAGHSKWANIKHVKGAQDKLKGQRANMLSRQLQAVLRKNPETDPKLNFDLANVIKLARSNNVPNDVIDRAIDRASKLRNPSSISVFDGRGLSNTAILIECFSINPKHTRQLLQGVVKKYGFNLNTSSLDLFDHKGIIEADVPDSELVLAQSDPDNFPLDKYVDVAIESGAEDVTLERNSEGPYLQFTCAPQDLERVQSAIDAEGIVVSSSERTYIPNLVVPVTKEFIETVEKLTEKLDLHADVIKYHFNVEQETSS